MSWIDDLGHGKSGLFARDLKLPPDYALQLETRMKQVDAGDMPTNTKSLDEWADLCDYIDTNNIELNEYQAEYIEKIDQYIKVKTFEGNKNSLYREILLAAIDNFPLYSRHAKAHEKEWLFPDEYGKKLPTKGGWILVTTEVPVEAKYAPLKFGVYYAKGVWSDHGIAQSIVKKYGIKSVPNAGRKYNVKISVRGQEVTLHTYEYIVLDDIREILESIGQGYEMVKGGGEANIELERVHYLLSRGMTQDEIYLRLLATVNSMTFCMFRPQAGFIEALEEEVDKKRYDNIKDNPFASFVPPKINVKW